MLLTFSNHVQRGARQPSVQHEVQLAGGDELSLPFLRKLMARVRPSCHGVHGKGSYPYLVGHALEQRQEALELGNAEGRIHDLPLTLMVRT